MKARVQLLGALAGQPGDNVGTIAIQDGFSYLASQRAGLRIVDLSTPARPKVVSRWNEGPGVFTAVPQGERVYVATQTGDIVVLDASRRDRLEKIATHRSGRRVCHLVAAGPLMVATDRDGISTLEISEPAPRELGRCDVPLASSASIAGERAYVAADFNGLRVLDLSDPSAPRETASCEKMANATRLTVRDGFAYVVDYEVGLWVIDVSQARPRVITQLGEGEGLVGDVAIMGRRLYVAAGALQVYDLADRGKPALLAELEPDLAIWALAAEGNLVYALGEGAELRVFGVA